MAKQIKGATHEKTHREGLTGLKDFIEVLPKYQEQANRSIGQVICFVSALERIMDSFIAEHFCKEKNLKQELCYLILSTNRMTYEGKREVLSKILKEHFPNLIEVHPNLLKDMQDIGELRNLMAHGLIDVHNFVDNVKNEQIVLKRYKGDVDFVIFDTTAVKEWIQLINNCGNTLRYWNTLTEVH